MSQCSGGRPFPEHSQEIPGPSRTWMAAARGKVLQEDPVALRHLGRQDKLADAVGGQVHGPVPSVELAHGNHHSRPLEMQTAAL